MCDLQEFLELYTELDKNPEARKIFAEKIFIENPQSVYKAAEVILYGEHLDKETMEDGLQYIKQETGKSMPQWSFEAFEGYIKRMELDFNEVTYNEYDVNFVAQMYASVHKSLGSDPQIFIKMAIERLDLNPEYAYQHYVELCDKYSM